MESICVLLIVARSGIQILNVNCSSRILYEYLPMYARGRRASRSRPFDVFVNVLGAGVTRRGRALHANQRCKRNQETIRLFSPANTPLALVGRESNGKILSPQSLPAMLR